MKSQLTMHNSQLKEGYKKTEVGVIPEDWEVKKLGEVSEFKQGYAFKSRDYTKRGIKLLKISNVGQNTIDWTDKSHLPIKYYYEYQTFELKENDIVMAMTRPIISTGIKVAKIRQVDTPCLLNQRVGKFITQDVYNSFLFHTLFSDNVLKRINILISASQQPNISAEQIQSIKVPIPPLKEQKKIATILSSVDEHIEEVDGMIEDLKELKKGLMQKLLTGQYSFNNSQLTMDNGQLKDEEIRLVKTKEFKKTKLGMIPKHWEVKKISDICNILDSKRVPLNSKQREQMKGDIPYYGANGIVDYINDYIFDEDLILLAEDGGNFSEYMTRPIAFRISGKSWVNNHAHILKPKNYNSFNWIFYSLEHKNILHIVQGGTRAKLNQKDLIDIKIAFPPLQEQKKIASILSSVDERIETYERQKEDIEELKKGLMQQLLTGKKRVLNN